MATRLCCHQLPARCVLSLSLRTRTRMCTHVQDSEGRPEGLGISTQKDLNDFYLLIGHVKIPTYLK